MKNEMMEVNKWFDLDKVFSTIEKSLHMEKWTDTDLQLLDVNGWYGEDDTPYIVITVAVVRYNDKGWPVQILGTVDVTKGEYEGSGTIYEYHTRKPENREKGAKEHV